MLTEQVDIRGHLFFSEFIEIITSHFSKKNDLQILERVIDRLTISWQQWKPGKLFRRS